MNEIDFNKKGWICPKCGAVLSPDTPFCPFCMPTQNTVEAWNGDKALLAVIKMFEKGESKE